MLWEHLCEPVPEACVIHANLDWQPQSDDVTGMLAGYKRPTRENVISFRLTEGRGTGMPEVWKYDTASRSPSQGMYVT